MVSDVCAYQYNVILCGGSEIVISVTSFLHIYRLFGLSSFRKVLISWFNNHDKVTV